MTSHIALPLFEKQGRTPATSVVAKHSCWLCCTATLLGPSFDVGSSRISSPVVEIFMWIHSDWVMLPFAVKKGGLANLSRVPSTTNFSGFWSAYAWQCPHHDIILNGAGIWELNVQHSDTLILSSDLHAHTSIKSNPISRTSIHLLHIPI